MSSGTLNSPVLADSNGTSDHEALLVGMLEPRTMPTTAGTAHSTLSVADVMETKPPYDVSAISSPEKESQNGELSAPGTPAPVTPVKNQDSSVGSDDLPDPPESPSDASSRPREPETTVSLDKEEEVSDLDKSPPTDPESSKYQEPETEELSVRADPNDNEDDSSNDDSSYFADPVHLPEPKSGRRYSWSSNISGDGGAGAAAGQNAATLRHLANAMSRESDASLSLSDDSDEGDNSGNAIHVHHHYPPFTQQHAQVPPPHSGQVPQPYHQQPQVPMFPQQHQQQQQMMFQPNPQVFLAQQRGGVPELYPEQIMPKMHSVSSLVSTSSQNSSQSDTSVRDELNNAVEQHRSGGAIPSGRRSPILGEHPPSRTGNIDHVGAMPFTSPFSPSTVHNPSPPTILQTYPPNSAQPSIPHPYPQPFISMTPDQMSAWRATQVPNNSMGMSAFGHGGVGERRGSHPSIASPYSKESDLAYSGDSDSQQLSSHQRLPSSAGSDARKVTLQDRSGGGESPMVSLMRGTGGGDRTPAPAPASSSKGFEVYWQRWLMLIYMSALNLLSDWTCYSVAPIALLTEEAFGSINAELLVVIFLCANGVSTACEPIILSRLGLKKTVLLGALLLMIGSIVKSGGLPPIIQAEMRKGEGEWRVYLGFFLVGLSQPLYQCTPALLSASWFPEKERTMATGVALNANQLGIGFAFIFGTLLVKNSDDIPSYFSLLSLISTAAFIGVLFQFDDAPPTPPSDTARVMRGTIEVNLPTVQSFIDSVRNMGSSDSVARAVAAASKREQQRSKTGPSKGTSKSQQLRLGTAGPSGAALTKELRQRGSFSDEGDQPRRTGGPRRTRKQKGSGQRGGSSEAKGSGRRGGSGSAPSARRRNVNKTSSNNAEGAVAAGFHGLAPAPSPARWGAVGQSENEDAPFVGDTDVLAYPAPSPMVPGKVGQQPDGRREGSAHQQAVPQQFAQYAPPYMMPGAYPGQPGYPGMGAPPVDEQGVPYSNQYQGYPPSQFQIPYWDPRMQQQAYFQHQQAQQAQHAYQQGYPIPPPDPYYSYYSYQHGAPFPPPTHAAPYNPIQNILPSAGPMDEGAEPVVIFKDHQLDIDIRDDQIWLSIRACFSRRGFIHSLVSFTVSGIVINTLSTFMDYLVRLNGAGREYTGIVGGTFQGVIMISSLLIGRVCDKTRAYYSITIAMLVFGAFGLAECGVSLDADRGQGLRYSLILVALLVGPLQPVSTELGVDVVYPLSENTVLVVQQLFSNLLSAAFIPCFKAMKDFGAVALENGETDRPEYTFSFYVLIVLHAAATVFFATFNGRYLRFEHEKEKLAIEEGKRRAEAAGAFHPIGIEQSGERAPLLYDM